MVVAITDASQAIAACTYTIALMESGELRAERLSLNPTLGWQVVEDIERGRVPGQSPVALDGKTKALIFRLYEYHPQSHPLGGRLVYEPMVNS